MKNKYYVYELIEDNEIVYCGFTNSPPRRKAEHRCRFQFEFDMNILSEHGTKREALAEEETMTLFLKSVGLAKYNDVIGSVVTQNLKKMVAINTGKVRSEETKRKISNTLKGQKHTKIRKLNMGKGIKNQTRYTCPHCGVVGVRGNMNRWHFDNCKQREYKNV